MHHMQLISDNPVGRYFCRGAAEHQEPLLKNHHGIIKKAAKPPDVVGEVNAVVCNLSLAPFTQQRIRFKLKALVPFGLSVYTGTPESGAIRKSGVSQMSSHLYNRKASSDYTPEHYSCRQLGSG